MTTRYEGAGAKDVSLTVAEAGEEVGEDVVPEGQVALLFNYDEVFYVQGTKPDVLTMLDRARDELTTPVESVEEPAVTAKVETEAGSPDIAWVRYGDLSVAVTRTLDGAIAISVESTTETPVRVAFSTTEKTLWEGEVR